MANDEHDTLAVTKHGALECRPPEDAQNGSYHWLQDSLGDFAPAKWAYGYWHVCGWATDTEPASEVARAGMTYVGPCIPPQETGERHG
ncbi:hypothetical protein Tasa_041_003 [Tanticharoenia sakaeratensis NBRC 103193]|uniref:Uncharacterized protein n=1 Tax=Tanticharoenia sakaeratensis NBRC 103193 TaxID=1231623 RepID=A0A0D6MPI3_9PROT|nr:hypothetical protein Tasa_041_003 [Tanticharoenia sakaeratensis NBRC 103193]GBQ23241.1 hypothetical protein AA103193_2346 [Tanticharoenia sakaeratensis NBRC 103193]